MSWALHLSPSVYQKGVIKQSVLKPSDTMTSASGWDDDDDNDGDLKQGFVKRGVS